MRILLLFILSSLSAYSQPAWHLNKEKDGVRVYTRQTERSSFNDIKVEVDLDGTLEQLRAILVDVEGYTDWVYATSVSKRVKTISPDVLIYYSIINAPWPASDRDFYAKATIQVNPTQGTLKMTSDVLADYGKEVKNKVRIPWSVATWTVTTLSDKTMHLEYIIQIDPGGSLPAWILNLFSTTAPLSSFSNLKEKMHALNK